MIFMMPIARKGVPMRDAIHDKASRSAAPAHVPYMTSFVAFLLLFLLASPARAQQRTPPDLLEMSLEQLMDVRVTSVSKRKQRLFEAPAAIQVVTAEDIRRSGVTTIAEAMRMVPGMQVAQFSANSWAVNSRCFNDVFANKLLVLIDGRSVYTPLFAGVYWDVQDLMLEDIERIEVIRGPGGAPTP